MLSSQSITDTGPSLVHFAQGDPVISGPMLHWRHNTVRRMLRVTADEPSLPDSWIVAAVKLPERSAAMRGIGCWKTNRSGEKSQVNRQVGRPPQSAPSQRSALPRGFLSSRMHVQTIPPLRKLALALVVLASLFGMAAHSAPSASADALPGGVTCYGDYCSGQDPVTTGCAADAVTVEAVQLDDGAGRLELRWSATCQTEWARWQQYPTGWCLNCAPLSLVAVQDTGYTQELDWFDQGTSPSEGGTYWTPMIYSPIHTVYAGVYMPCGGETFLATAADCLQNGLVRTDSW